MPMTIKLGKMVSYCKGLPCLKSHNPVNTCSHEMKSRDRLNIFCLYCHKASGH